MMLAMVYKDLLMLKKWILITALLIILMATSTLDASMGMVFPLASMMMAFVVTSMGFGYDEKSNFMAFALASPVTRREYAISKYILPILCGVVGAVATVLVESLLYQKDWGMILIEVALTFSIPILILSIIIPFFLKYGPEKGRLPMMVVYILLLNLFIQFSTNLMDFFGKILAGRTISSSGLAAVILAVGLLVLVISLNIAIRIMEQKELS
ncbi:MAG: ABC-2 transporter permease [Tissierellia bacterium]|nr:ABC-2 transporter permease [Tissierellia bacterium]